MTKTHTIIKFNGKSYDAITGKLISHDAPAAKQLSVRSIDGVVAGHTTAKEKPMASHSARKATVSNTVHKVHTPAPAAQVKRAHPSKTIMRHAVKKPSTGLRAQLAVQAPTAELAPVMDIALAPKLSITAVDKRREARAKRVNKSKLVSRFGAWDFMAPVSATRYRAQTKEPLPEPTSTAHHSTHALPAQKHNDLFEKALQRANGHELPPAPAKTRAHAIRRHPRARRLTNFSAAALAVVLVGGFLAYQNVANVTLHMASSKAGFAASLPAYRPSGFSVGRFAYSPGNVTIQFHSNSDASRSFAIAEKPSNWDSATLLNDYVATSGQDYQTVETAGRTLYLYGNKQATWVNNGVWYRVDGGTNLSTNQLVSLASSM